jgi:hypothetical protein
MSVKSSPPGSSQPMMKNAATAPLVYFDSVPSYGFCNGSISIELATAVILSKADGGTTTDLMCTAHLRCSPLAAKLLLDTLTAAITMMETQLKMQQEQLRPDSVDDYRPN